MPTPAIIPPWLHGPADPGATYLSGYHTAAQIALQNQEMAQRMRIAEMAQSMRADEFNANQTLAEQEMAQKKAYQDAQLGLASDAAAKKYQAMQEYQQAIAGGMNPLDAILKYGPSMGQQASAEAAAMRVQSQQGQNVPPTLQTATIPGGVDQSDYEASGTPIEDYYDDQTAGIIPQPKSVTYMQRGNHPVQFVPQSAISGGDGEGDVPTFMEGPEGSTIVYRKKGGAHVIMPARQGQLTPDAASKGLQNINQYPKEMRQQVQAGMSNVLQSALSPRAPKRSTSPIERALAGTNAIPLPTKAGGKEVDFSKLEIGHPYISNRGIVYYTGIKGHEYSDVPLDSITGQPTAPAGEAPPPDDIPSE